MDPKKQGNSKISGFLRRKDGIKLEDIDKNAAPSDHSEFIQQKLTEAPKEPLFAQSHEGPSFSIADRVKKAKYYAQFYRRRVFKDIFPMAVFVSFSCFLLWKMEQQLDGMRRKVFVQKTIKQQEIEKENELIETALRSNKFEQNIQIQEVEPALKYRFEDSDDGEDEGHINTKADVFIELETQEDVDKEYNRGNLGVDPEFRKRMEYLKKQTSQPYKDDYYQETI